ncbi:MAG TPA: NAD(P)H-hydrate dehydratase [Candidatus Eisenbacteria bacterium]
MLLLTAAEMRELDRATIESGHATGQALMERAGAGVAEAMERRYGPALALRVLVLCGTGNNGGDGFVAARHLRVRGAETHVGLAGERARVRGEALAHLERLEREGASVVELRSEDALERFLATRERWDFALDALLGTGARGGLEGLVAAGAQALRDLDDAGTRVVAVDLPTGVHPDTGEIARRAVRADLTVTFGAPKRGHLLYPGRAFVGALEVVDIGLLPAVPEGGRFAVELATAIGTADLLPAREPRAHKGSAGRVLVAGGSPGLTGAVALAARAATRAGAGYVQCAVPASLNDILEIKLTPEMTLPAPETGARTLSRAALERITGWAARADAVLVGSGLSRNAESAALARGLVAARTRPTVLDADGLNAFEGRPAFEAPSGAPIVLTPHLGEMARLTGETAAALEAWRIDAAREAASSWKAVVVLKGAPTVTAGPDGRATVNPTGNPGLATAGTGDVLAGMIAALLAQRLDPYDAARAAVYVHGLAADRLAGEKGQLGLDAVDVLEAVPAAMLALTRARDEALEKRLRPA